MKTLLLSLILTLVTPATFATECQNGPSNRLANDAVKILQSRIGLDKTFPTKNTSQCRVQWLRSYFADFDGLKDNLNFGISCGVEIEFPTEKAMEDFFSTFITLNNGYDEITVFDLFANMAVPVCGKIK